MVGLSVAGAAGWALWDGRASESGSARAGLCALCVWAGALALGALAALGGAARHSASLLAAAFALLALTAVAEAAAAWWGAAHLPQLQRALAERLEHTVRKDYGVLHARSQALDAIQQGVSAARSAAATPRPRLTGAGFSSSAAARRARGTGAARPGRARRRRRRTTRARRPRPRAPTPWTCPWARRPPTTGCRRRAAS